MDQGLNLSELSNISFSQFGPANSDIPSSTPIKRRPTPAPRPRVPRALPGQIAGNPSVSAFRAPAVPKERQTKNPPKVVCKECGKPYVCLKSYQNHLQRHAVEKASSKFPNEDLIKENLPYIDSNVLSKLECCTAYGLNGSHFKQLVTQVLSQAPVSPCWNDFRQRVCVHFSQSVATQKFLLPSKLMGTLITACENLSSDLDKRVELTKYLEPFRCQDIPEVVLHNFIGTYILQFTYEFLCFISSSLRGGSGVRDKRFSEVITFDEEWRQVVFHQAGSVMRGFYRKAYSKLKHVGYQKIKAVIEETVLEGPNVKAANVARGSLLKVGDKCFQFFLELAKICYVTESVDGSISYNEVLSAVHMQGVSAMWDDLIGTSLSETESLDMMNVIVVAYVQSYGRGISKRHVNEKPGKATAPVTLRHSVAPK